MVKKNRSTSLLPPHRLSILPRNGFQQRGRPSRQPHPFKCPLSPTGVAASGRFEEPSKPTLSATSRFCQDNSSWRGFDSGTGGRVHFGLHQSVGTGRSMPPAGI